MIGYSPKLGATVAPERLFWQANLGACRVDSWVRDKLTFFSDSRPNTFQNHEWKSTRTKIIGDYQLNVSMFYVPSVW